MNMTLKVFGWLYEYDAVVLSSLLLEKARAVPRCRTRQSRDSAVRACQYEFGSGSWRGQDQNSPLRNDAGHFELKEPTITRTYCGGRVWM